MQNLKSITIPNNVTEIGEDAFNSCENLTSITIPNSVTTIEDSAFAGCKNLKRFYGKFATPDGKALIDNGRLISYAHGNNAESYTIPNNVTEIGENAFSSCENLKSATIPNSVTKIAWYAFSHCTNLTSITIPNSVTEIGCGVFSGCKSLKHFYGKFATSDGKALIDNGRLISYAHGNNAESYTIPNSVTEIEYNAFMGCENLKSITIPDSVTDIFPSAFMDCINLTSITIPDSVRDSMSHGVFKGCKNLRSVTLPKCTMGFGYSVFEDCTSLMEVYCKATTPPFLLDSAFDDNASGRKIYVPRESVEAYKTANGWKDYASAIVGYDF